MTASPTARRARLNVGFLLTESFTLGAFANFVDVLRLAADEGDGSRQINCAWKILSGSNSPIISSSGVAVHPDERGVDLRHFDYIVLVGGLLQNTARLSPWQARTLQEAADAGIPLVALCTGAFDLTKLGLMKGYKCCVSWFHHEDFLSQFDRTQPVSDQLYVVDRDRLTCSGGVGSAHLAALLVNRHVGTSEAVKSLNIMMIDRALGGEMPQPQSEVDFHVEDHLVRRAIHLIRQHMTLPHTTSELAARLGVSRRQLERRFKAALGESPARVSRRIRLRHGQALLARHDRSMAEIAEETGFCDTSHFIRSYRNEFGVSVRRPD